MKDRPLPRQEKETPPLFRLPVELVKDVTDHLCLEDKRTLALTCKGINRVVAPTIWGRMHLDLCKVVTRPDRGLSCYRGSNWEQDPNKQKQSRIAVNLHNVVDVVKDIEKIMRQPQDVDEKEARPNPWQMVHTFSVHVELESENVGHDDTHTVLERLFWLLPRVMNRVSRVKFFCGGELSNRKNGTTFCGGMDSRKLVQMLRYYAGCAWNLKLQGIACHVFHELTSFNVNLLQIRSLYDEAPWSTLQYMMQSSEPALPKSIKEFEIDGAFGAAWTITYDTMGQFFKDARQLRKIHTSPPIADLAAFEGIPSGCETLSFSYYKNRSTVSREIYLPQVHELQISCDTLEFLPYLSCGNLQSLKISGAPSLNELVGFLAHNPVLESLSISAATATTQIPSDLLRYNKHLVNFEANQHFFDTLQPFFQSKGSVRTLVICVATNKDAIALRCIKYALKVFPNVSSIRVTGHTTDSWIEHTNWAKLIGVERKSSGLNVDLDKCQSYNTSRPASPMPMCY